MRLFFFFFLPSSPCAFFFQPRGFEVILRRVSPDIDMQIRDPRLTGVCLACERPIASRRSAWRPLQHKDDAIVHCSDCARFLEGYFSITFVKDRGYLWVAWGSLFRCQNGENPCL